ncbi:MAG: hypothetical protein KDC44_09210, partial [Phaeodactylibacter sp.]|nr:hypothetical protein [Phaeodactylibacter sp.]
MKKLTLTLFVQLLAIAVWAQYEMVDAQFSILEQALEMAQAQKPSKELLETRGETFIRIATRGENWENEEWVATDSSSFSFDAELLEIGGHSFRSENAQ